MSIACAGMSLTPGRSPAINSVRTASNDFFVSRDNSSTTLLSALLHCQKIAPRDFNARTATSRTTSDAPAGGSMKMFLVAGFREVIGDLQRAPSCTRPQRIDSVDRVRLIRDAHHGVHLWVLSDNLANSAQ